MAEKKNRMLAALDKIAAWASPTIDATPGKETLEDKIDRFVFDPQSSLAPLELALMGGGRALAQTMKNAKAGKEALKGAKPDTWGKAIAIAEDPAAAARKWVEHKGFEGAFKLGASMRKDVDKAVTGMSAEARGDLLRYVRQQYPGLVERAQDWKEVVGTLLSYRDPKIEKLMPLAAKAKDRAAMTTVRTIMAGRQWFPPGDILSPGQKWGGAPIATALMTRERMKRLADNDKDKRSMWDMARHPFGRE